MYFHFCLFTVALFLKPRSAFSEQLPIFKMLFGQPSYFAKAKADHSRVEFQSLLILTKVKIRQRPAPRCPKFYCAMRVPRKEVIHAQLPLRMPCYDFTLVTDPTLGPRLILGTSGVASSLGVTGGEYKTRERIHRSIADLRLLAIPTS